MAPSEARVVTAERCQLEDLFGPPHTKSRCSPRVSRARLAPRRRVRERTRRGPERRRRCVPRYAWLPIPPAAGWPHCHCRTSWGEVLHLYGCGAARGRRQLALRAVDGARRANQVPSYVNRTADRRRSGSITGRIALRALAGGVISAFVQRRPMLVGMDLKNAAFDYGFEVRMLVASLKRFGQGRR